MLFAPVLVALIFVLKGLCPGSVGSACFADFFATPIFLPLVAIYKIFGYAPSASGGEVAFIFLYWALVGFVLGLILDLYKRPPQYSPAQRPPL